MRIKVHSEVKAELAKVELQLSHVISDFGSEAFTASRFYEATGGEPAEIALAKKAVILRARRRQLKLEIKVGELVEAGANWTLDEGNKTLYVDGLVLDLEYVKRAKYTGGPSSMAYIDVSYWTSPEGGITI